MMRSKAKLLPLVSLLCLVAMVPAHAQGQQDTPRPAPAAESERPGPAVGSGLLALLPQDSTTEQTFKGPDGTPAVYRVTAGTLPLFGANGERTAAIFYTAYVLKERSPGRPVTFAFNGGPGAASAYLHLGLVGPKVLDFGPGGREGASASLVDNQQTWLPFTDIVLLDPIGTGWSRTAKPEDAEKFYGVRADAQVMAKVISLYVTRNDRASSPKILLGESYGGFRAAKTAEALRLEQGILVNAIIMLSPLIDGGLIFSNGRSPLNASLLLPSLAAARLQKSGAERTDDLRAAERFAQTDYLVTLAGPSPKGESADAFYRRVAELSGLPLASVRRERGFVGPWAVKELLADRKEVVSIYDATIVAPDAYPESAAERGPDPTLSGFTRAYGGAFANYARNVLGFKTDMTYVLLADDISGKWDWGGQGRRSSSQANASDDLREALALSPGLRVLIAHGLTDLITPYSASRYVIDHLPPELASDRVQLKTYPGGHMFYTSPLARAAFFADVRNFYAAR